DGTGTSARFNQPYGMTMDAAGNIYIADAGNNNIRKGVRVTGGGSSSSSGGSSGSSSGGGSSSSGSGSSSGGSSSGSSSGGGSSGGSSSGGSGNPTVFLLPAAMAIDSSNNLYIADTGNHSIKKISSAGVGSQLAGTDGTVGSADGTGAAASFHSPAGIAVDGGGNVYVADTGNGTIRKITSAGVVTTLAGSPANRGTQDGTGSAAYFNAPTGIAVDPSGNVYVTDATSDTIRKITGAGVVTTIAGSAAVVGESDGTGSSALFSGPFGLCSDTSGNLYVADTNNHTVRFITSGTGVVTTIAGSAGISGSFDGTHFDALFNLPHGVSVASSTGYLYVADTANSVIRKVTTSGGVTTVTGLAGISGLRNSAAGLPLFNQPQAVVVDTSNNIFVADTGNSVIRKVATDGSVTTLVPSASSTTTPSSGGGSGGGSFSSVFAGLLALLAGVRGLTRRHRARAA
ncbi:MAG: hypothetical protein ACHQ5A_03290, partial [Opitutales bacterium]